MKKNLLFALLICFQLPAFSQSVFENPEIRYEIMLEEFWSSADNDNVTLDDLVMQLKINASPSNFNFNWCENWTGNAPCSTLKDPFDPTYHLNVDNADILEYIVVNFEGWEDDGGALCTYDNGDDFYINLTPTLRNNGFVAGLGETQSRWETKNSIFNTEFLFFQSALFDLRYRIAWRHVHGEDINDPLRFGYLNLGENVATGGTNRFSLLEANNPYLGWANNGGQNTADTYYQFSLNKHSKVTISTDNSGRTFDTYLTLYDANHNVLQADDDSGNQGDGYGSMIIRVLPPGTYYINAEGSDVAISEDQKTGEYVLSIKVELPNDDPCTASYLPANDVTQTGYSNATATTVPGEGAIIPAAEDCITAWCVEENEPRISNSIWFKFDAPATGAVEISTCGLADFDTQLALYDVADCGTFNQFTLIGANDDGVQFGQPCNGYSSLLSKQGLVPGKTYYLMVDGFDGAVGSLGIKVTPILSTAVQNLEATSDLLLAAPNPSNGWLNIRLQGGRKIEAYTLSDMHGRVVQTVHFQSTMEEENLDLGLLPKGVYLLQVRTGDQILTQKIVLQ